MRVIFKSMTVLGVIGGALLCGAAAHALDAKRDWMTLESVRRIAIISPFFCTETLTRKPADAEGKAYQSDLRALEATMRKSLPRSLAEPGRYRIAPPALTARALRALHWTPRDLFAANGVARKGDWPAPDLQRIAKVAQRLNVDAIFLGTMREPASIGDGLRFHHDNWNPNPLNWGFQRIRPHVLSPRVRAFLVTRNGTVVWQDEQMADHPRTKQRTERTLLLDWQEATAQVAQQLADSLYRLPPPDLDRITSQRRDSGTVSKSPALR
jgi:hypothetical protein